MDASARSSTKALGLDAAVYALSEILLRGLAFALLPVYTHYLSPAEYGLLNLANVYVGLLGTVMTLAIQSSIVRLYFMYEREERRRFLGTLLGFMLVVPGAIALALDALARTGRLTTLIQGLPQNYFRLAVWTAFV